MGKGLRQKYWKLLGRQKLNTCLREEEQGGESEERITRIDGEGEERIDKREKRKEKKKDEESLAEGKGRDGK